jgi:DNA-binding NtrC family response regulator
MADLPNTPDSGPRPDIGASDIGIPADHPDGGMVTDHPISRSRPDDSPDDGTARVLLIDDNDLYASLIQAILADAPYEVLVAPSIAAAHAQLAVTTVRCLLVDRRLPDGDGLDALAGLRDAAGGVPGIVMSGDPDPALAESARRAGATGVLMKGDELDGLAPALAAALATPPARAAR